MHGNLSGKIGTYHGSCLRRVNQSYLASIFENGWTFGSITHMEFSLGMVRTQKQLDPHVGDSYTLI